MIGSLKRRLRNPLAIKEIEYLFHSLDLPGYKIIIFRLCIKNYINYIHNSAHIRFFQVIEVVGNAKK